MSDNFVENARYYMLTFSEYLMEMSISRIQTIIQGLASDVKTIGIMTPTNPEAKQFSSELNNLFISQFIDKLRSEGFHPIEIRGKFSGNPEKSFLIKNISKKEIIDLGRRYNQESVIWGSRDYENNMPNFRYEYIENGKTVRKANNIEFDIDRNDNYSTIKGNKKFVIPF